MFDRDLLIRKFQHIGARLRLGEPVTPRWGSEGRSPFTLDVERDRRGELFSLRIRPDSERLLELMVVDTCPNDRHLLLMACENPAENLWKNRFLCGHDERFWFVATVPSGASNVQQAKEALKPEAALQSQARNRVKTRDRNRRRNDGFIRQGEWFFIPQRDLVVPSSAILRNEPLSRGSGSKPHMVSDLVRHGGQTVYVCGEYPLGLDTTQHHTLIRRHPEKAKLDWRIRVRNPEAYARGRVTHRDHRTVVLPFWHLIAMNTEEGAPGSRNVVFLD